MRQDIASRIMSLSFERKPQEHAEIMLAAGRRFIALPGSRYNWSILIAAVAFGSATGLVMEAYRRFLLVPLLGTGDVAPLSVIVLQLVPFLVAVGCAVYVRTRQINKKRLQTLVDRIRPGQFIDTDIFPDGIVATTGPTVISLEWAAIRDISVRGPRAEFEGETFILYVSERAFPDRAGFEAAVVLFRALWRDALGRRELAREGAVGIGADGLTPD